MPPFYYLSFGLTLQSNVPLAELYPLPTAPATIDVDVVATPDPIIVTGEVATDTQDLRWQIGTEARFQVSEGKRIHINFLTQPPTPRAQQQILSHALPILLYQRGYLLLHGSMVAVGSLGAAILGFSGMGKSSLVMGLHQRGYRIVTDDIVCVQWGPNQTPLVTPGGQIIKLTAETYQHFNLQQAVDSVSSKGKYIVTLPDFDPAPVQLQAAYVLAPVKEYEYALHPLMGMVKINALQRHVMRRRLSKRLLEPQQRLQQIIQLARYIPMGRLRRGQNLHELPAILDELTADLRQRGLTPAL